MAIDPHFSTHFPVVKTSIHLKTRCLGLHVWKNSKTNWAQKKKRTCPEMEEPQPCDKGTNGARAWPIGNLFSLKRWFIAVNDGWKKRPNENIFLNWWYMKFLVMFILISRIRIKNDKKKHVRPVLQTTISCQSNYSIVKKIKVRLVELRGMPHQLEKSETHQNKTQSLGRIMCSFF